MDRKPRLFSYGGGVQSNAVLVLSASGVLPYTHFIFANVGHDSENPKTIEYIEQVAKPYAEKHGLFIIEVNSDADVKLKRTSVLQETLENTYAPFIPMAVNGVPAKRFCTQKYKIKVIEAFMHRWLKATKSNPKPIGIGISLEEWHRAKTSDKYESMQIPEYPLLELRYLREDCVRVIQEAGLPVPPKSSCWFCPYKKKSEWVELAKDSPELFAKAVEIENTVQSRYGDAKVTFHSGGYKLTELIQTSEEVLNDDINCEGGYCMV